jgi:hypothetical protein
MLAKLHFTTADARGMAFGQPIDVAIAAVQASARTLDRASEQTPSRSETFGRRIAQALEARLHHSKEQPRSSPVFAESGSDESSFAERLRKQVAKRSGRKRHQEYVKRETERQQHRRAAPPPPRKGE